MPEINGLVLPYAADKTPTGNGDPYWDSVTFLSDSSAAAGSQSIKNSVYGNNVVVFGNAQTSLTQQKFSGYNTIYLDGTGDAIETGNAAIVGTGAFTLEYWVYCSAFGTYNIFSDQRTASPSLAPMIYCNSSGTLYYHVNGGNQITKSGNLSINTWYHIALCRSGTTTKMFVNGTQAGSNYTDSNSYIPNKTRFGMSFDGSGMSGFMYGIRYTSGVARYTADFTEPAAPLPSYGRLQQNTQYGILTI